MWVSVWDFFWFVGQLLFGGFFGGSGFFWLVGGFLDLRVNNYLIFTLSAHGVWMKRGAIDEVTKKERNC